MDLPADLPLERSSVDAAVHELREKTGLVEAQGNVTAASHQPRALRTVRWDATNTFEFGEAG